MALPSTDTDDHTDDVDTAAKLFMEYGDFIRAAIRYQVKNEIQVDDLFQDFFVSLAVRPIPADVRNIKGYLYRAISNKVIETLRRAENSRKHLRKYAKRLNHSINKENPEHALIEAEETDKTFELIERHLRRSYARAITLRYRDNYDIKEVAKEMKVGSESIKKYIQRGFSKIRYFLTNMKERH